MDIFTKRKRSLIMSKIKSSGTDIERHLLLIVRDFWATERYRKNYSELIGKPDVVFLKSKLIIFADGDFWHGKNFNGWKKDIPDFWKKKIQSNMDRDKKQNAQLKKRGYKILRFWGSSIKKHPENVKNKIEKCIVSKL